MEQLIMAGKPVADHYRRAIAAKIAAAKDRGLITSLNVIVVGDDEASHVYKNRLAKMMASLGGETKEILRPASATQEEVVALIKKLNRNRYVTGILPLLPMPAPIKGAEAAAVIAANKDVDCFNSGNMGEFYAGRNRWAPCTPRACLAILDYYRISLSGRSGQAFGSFVPAAGRHGDRLPHQNGKFGRALPRGRHSFLRGGQGRVCHGRYGQRGGRAGGRGHQRGARSLGQRFFASR